MTEPKTTTVDPMRATPGYEPIRQPGGTWLDFEKLVAPLRKQQLRMETMVATNPELEFNKNWRDGYAYVTQQIALCAESFRRSHEALPSNNGQESAGGHDAR